MSEPSNDQLVNWDDWMTFPEDYPSSDSMLPVEGGMDLSGVSRVKKDGLSLAPAYSAATSSCMSPSFVNNVPKRWVCTSCKKDFGDKWYFRYHLERHVKETGHAAFSCSVRGCNQLFFHVRERDAHQKRPHTPGHGRRPTATSYECIQCGESLSSKADLLRHANKLQHQPYPCECGTSFSRLDVMNRHLEKFAAEEPKYPCKYCKLHRGPMGFRRRDHLNQHMRNYHHLHIESKNVLRYSFPVCSYPECPQYRDDSFTKMARKQQDENKPFPSRSAYTSHMRDAHNETPYPCDILGCSRVGRRGYFREKDFIKHRKDEHPECEAYQVIPRGTRTNCPTCGVDLDLSSLPTHVMLACPKREVTGESGTEKDYS